MAIKLSEKEFRDLFQDIDAENAQTVDEITALKIEKLRAEIDAIKARESVYTERKNAIMTRQNKPQKKPEKSPEKPENPVGPCAVWLGWIITAICLIIDLIFLAAIT